MKGKITGCLILGGLLIACQGANQPQPTGGNDAAKKLQVSGSISNLPLSNVTNSTRVLLGWSVSSGSPDYIYVYGEGSINLAAGTFPVDLLENPPAEALNARGLGVGLIFLTNDMQIQNGAKIYGDTFAIAGASNHAVIFIRENPDNLAVYPDAWPTRFPAGYSAAEGYDILNSNFDGFRPTSNAAITIETDLIAHPWLNWT